LYCEKIRNGYTAFTIKSPLLNYFSVVNFTIKTLFTKFTVTIEELGEAGGGWCIHSGVE
jgi:hypothetical protein